MNASKLPGGASYGATWAIGDIIGIALDLDSAQNTVTFYKNGSSQGSININNAKYVFCNSNGQGSSTVTYVSNFGQDSTFSGAKPMGAFTDANSIGNFQYAPPAGYLALCTANLPTPTIIDGSEHFDTLTWSKQGADNSTITLTGLQFQPDFVWAKGRSNAMSHQLFDAVRGTGKTLFSDTTDAEVTNIGNGYISSFNSDGFTAVSGSSNNFYFNYQNGYTYAAWNWKAGGTAVSNTDGSITSQVSANVDAGFSIVSWTGNAVDNSTIGHSLASPPEMIITKKRNEADSWNTFHKDLTAGSEIFLDLTNAQIDDANNASWGDNHPSSVGASTFAIGYAGDMNGSGKTYIAYCFHSVDGFSKAGSYTGNGSADGPFVYTGFRPAWVMVKQTSGGATGWLIYDTARDTFNEADAVLQAHVSTAEVTAADIDIVSNGWKFRTNDTAVNGSGATYIYLAFAETPFKYANAR